jgi:hypothetical protein
MLRRARKGVRGGADRPPLGGSMATSHKVVSLIFVSIFGWSSVFMSILGVFSTHGFSPMVFYFRLRN